MSGAGPWGAPAPGGGVSVAWTGGAPVGVPTSGRPTPDVGAVLRLVTAGLLLLAAGLTAIAPFCDLLTIAYEDGPAFTVTGWEDESGAPGTAIRFGVPLVVVAALLLTAAGLTAAGRWVAPWRRAARGCAVLAVGALVAVAWLVTGFARDVVDSVTEYGEASWAEAGTGTGTLLATLAPVVGLAALTTLLVGAVLDRAASTRAGTR